MFRVKIQEAHRQIEFNVQSEPVNDIEVYIESHNEKDLTSSNRFRTRLQCITRSLYSEFRSQARTYIRAILHNTLSTETLIRQNVERYTRKVPHTLNHSERVEAFSKIISDQPHEFAKSLLFLEQRAIDLDAQLIGMNILIGRPYEKKVVKNPLKSLIWRCFQPFTAILKKQSVSTSFENVDDALNIKADFRLFNCAMYHFFDNIQKYIKPDSQLVISVDSSHEIISFTMISRALDEGEKTRIFDEGYSGKNSGSQKGEGFGMYIFAKVLKEMGATPSVDWEEQALVPFEGQSYRTQVFSIKFPAGLIQ